MAIAGEPTVFLIDDDHALRQSVVALANSMQLPLEMFGTADDFIKRSDAARSGCLLVEMRLPGMSGLELLEKIRSEEHFFAVIAVSAKADAGTVARAMKAGAIDFLDKPVTERRLWDSLHQALERYADHRKLQNQLDRIERRKKKLTDGEKDVLAMLMAGKMNREIAAALAISVRTVEVRRAKVMEKMKAGSLAELIRDVLFLTFFAEKKSKL